MGRLISGLAIAALALAACTGNDPNTVQSVATATPGESEAETQEATPGATQEPTASPTPEPEIADPEIVSFSMADDMLSVRLHNPNSDHGLIRAPFELAVLDADGAIITVTGTEGLPGASCCTIYQLPPGGDFGLSIFMPPDSPAPAALELTVPGSPWIEWSDVDAAMVTVENPTLRQDFSLTLTGRMSVDQPGPFNAWIGAFVQTAEGEAVITGFVECLTADTPRAFEVSGFFAVSGAATLSDVVAYPSTVEGHGDSFTPDC